MRPSEMTQQVKIYKPGNLNLIFGTRVEEAVPESCSLTSVCNRQLSRSLTYTVTAHVIA